jgi:serine/threonine-protein kinase SRPK3
VIQILGEPKQIRVVTESGESPTTAPKYLVRPVDFYKVDPRFITDQAYIIDFGESFEASDPPEDLGIPEAYCSPELILDKVASIGSDLWALGCTLFEIRTGRKLFDSYDDDMDSHLYCMVLRLGKLPEPWWTAWEARQNWFEKDSDPQSRGRTYSPATEKPDQEGLTDALHPIPSEPRSIQEALAPGLWYMDMDIGDEIHRDIPEDEIGVFADLLGKLLKYLPQDRLTANAAQDHEWFRM